tara:strand:- start:3961 stop:4941 length:981 start_codon:yes stop_codon:yes gene_type:complete
MDLIIGNNSAPKPAQSVTDEAGQPMAGSTGGTAPTGADIIDVTIAEFEAEVINASMERPVLIDFWADWCGPCKQLTPILEKVIAETRGAVRLAKINADQNPELCQMLQVQSLPTVFALYQGRPVDAFMGAQPESQIREFVTKVAKLAGPATLPLDAMVEQGNAALEGDDPEQAYELFASVLAENGDHAKALAGAARALLAMGETEAAKELLAELPPNLAVDSDIMAAKSAIEVAEQAADAGPLTELQAAVDANPDDHQARLDLAIAAFTAGQHELAMDTLLDSIGLDREWQEGAARQQLLKYFETLGPGHELTSKYRRKLSSVLFS